MAVLTMAVLSTHYSCCSQARCPSVCPASASACSTCAGVAASLARCPRGSARCTARCLVSRSPRHRHRPPAPAPALTRATTHHLLLTAYYLLGSTALSGSLPRAVLAHAAGLWELQLPATATAGSSTAAAAVPLPPLSPLAPLLERRFKPFSYGWGGRLMYSVGRSWRALLALGCPARMSSGGPREVRPRRGNSRGAPEPPSTL